MVLNPDSEVMIKTLLVHASSSTSLRIGGQAKRIKECEEKHTTNYEDKRMSTGEGSNKYSFISFVLSVLGFFFFSIYYIGGILGAVAIVVSFLAEDLAKEKSLFQYLTIIIAVVDIMGAILGWNLVIKSA